MKKKEYVRPEAKEKMMDAPEMMVASLTVDMSNENSIAPENADSKQQSIWDFMED
ncbi:MAG: hypothetical protein PUH24_06550 [Prevotellaceae bacterium]|nr:hypothetical protein [Prevotella sp.]MDD7257910.1 hypothetical protein [Prevotellaceae bacterium]MDY6130307.1 hypothetical protein [Prevotella sp.]